MKAPILFRFLKKSISLIAFFFVVALAAPIASISANAASESKVVRVGWYETPLDKTDQFGRKVGYNYEYLCKVAAYTDWTYEYVNGSWPDLMQMLLDGKLDLMTDVSYTEERTEYMLYSSLPMGTEDYYLFIAADNAEYIHGDYTYFNNKRIGVNKGSVQIGYFNEWAKKHGITAELVELVSAEEDSVALIVNGELDAYLGIDSYGGIDTILPVVKIGGSEFFFAVDKKRHDLFDELEIAMGKIQDENPFYNQMLYEKYYRSTGASLFITADEQKWLNEHKKVRVGYQDNYLAYCSKEKATGNLTGALKDFLALAADCIANTHIDFEPVCYETSSKAIEGLRKGEVDCVFPINFGNYEAEQLGISVSSRVMSAEISALVRSADKSTFYQKKNVLVAVVRDDLNYNSVLMDIFPDWKAAYYASMEECLRAVSEGKADCFLISNYRYNSMLSFCEKYGLVSMETNEHTDYCFAVAGNEKELYSIIGRLINLVPSTSINAALTYYYAEETHMSFGEFLGRNPLVIVVAAVVVVALILIIVVQSRMIVVKKQATSDALTGVKNRRAYFDAEEKMDHLIAEHNQPAFAISIFDVNELKRINDTEGHQAGDQYLRDACKVICEIFDHSPVYRVGGDEFVVISQGPDYDRLDELLAKVKEHNEEASKNGGIVIACGVAKYEQDESVALVFERADRNMYENKNYWKSIK